MTDYSFSLIYEPGDTHTFWLQLRSVVFVRLGVFTS